MRVYLFAESPEALTQLGTSSQQVRQVLARIFPAATTPALVVAAYFPNDTVWCGQVCGGPRMPATFQQHREDHWAIVERWRAPQGLPESYTLIRLLVGADITYPCTDTDHYGWTWTFPSALAHLAVVASHERYHLTHRGQPADVLADERTANHWALHGAWNRGYRVQATLPADAMPRPARPSGSLRNWRPAGVTRMAERAAAAHRSRRRR